MSFGQLDKLKACSISRYEEMLAYETLWAMPKVSLKVIAEWFNSEPGVPSRLLEARRTECLMSNYDTLLEAVTEHIKRQTQYFSVCVHGTFQYPKRLRDAKYPLELFYYRGDIGLTESKSISIVGARKCSIDGAKRAAKLAKGLVERGFTIVSGLAAGIDTAAMTAAIEAGGNVIGVIGTPINEYYPKENRGLQDDVAERQLLVSQVPFYRYAHEPFNNHRFYFPQRNETMAALSEATVIVEASDTSGTMSQAKACIHQGRKLFILNSCFENPDITWPKKFEAEGAIRVRDFDDIFSVIGNAKRTAGEEDGEGALDSN